MGPIQVVVQDGNNLVLEVTPTPSTTVVLDRGIAGPPGPAGTGNVNGPASATDNAVARFDGTTGKLIQNSVVLVGDTGAVTGVTDLSASGAVTLSGGTANGVAYLNGSKVLTTGSALTFDGTNLGVLAGSVTTPAAKIHAVGNIRASTGTGTVYSQLASDGVYSTGTDLYLLAPAGKFMSFYADNSEQMRLTSTGLGIGTSSPAYKLDVSGTAGYNAYIYDSPTTGGVLIGGSSTRGLITSNSGTKGLALQINGTTALDIDTSGNVGIGTSSPAFKLDVSGANAQSIRVTSNNGDVASLVMNSVGNNSWSLVSDTVMRFRKDSTEYMRLDASGNLGIGTSSPLTPLHVVGAIQSQRTGGVAQYARMVNSGGTATFVSDNQASGTYTGFDFQGLSTASGTPVTYATITGSGNLGLGVTPSAWGTANSERALQLNGGSLWSFSTFGLGLINNAFYNSSGNYIYSRNGFALDYFQSSSSGGHIWRTAPSGTAGNAISFTQAMTLDASSNLLVGGTSVYSATITSYASAGRSGGLGIRNSAGTAAGGIYTGAAGSGSGSTDVYVEGVGLLGFITNGSERARITSGGNLLVGTSSELIGTSRRLSVEGLSAATFKNTAGAGTEVINVWNPATSGDNVFIEFDTETSVTGRGTISYNRGAGLVAYNVTSDYRAKDIIGPVADSGALIDSVPVYMGKMKGATQERPMFIAHETPAYAHTGVKDAVDADGKPVYQQMDASALIPVMWAEIQSLRTRLAALEAA